MSWKIYIGKRLDIHTDRDGMYDGEIVGKLKEVIFLSGDPYLLIVDESGEIMVNARMVITFEVIECTQ